MIENINWYPGHMKKTRELISENLRLVDLVIEVIDARIPNSSRNPIINQLLQDKKRIIVLNKKDLAEERESRKWLDKLSKESYKAISLNSALGTGLKDLTRLLIEAQDEKNEDKILKKPLRIMIVGVPNVGKSSLINRLTGRKSTQTGDRPGVTKGKQWLTLTNSMQLLDTPGILWPKFEDPEVGLNLAFCGSIKDEIMDIATLGLELIKFLEVQYPKELIHRYNLDTLEDETLVNMEKIALKRGFILPGKKIDYERCGRVILDEFRSGKIGKITLEKADDKSK